jgi:cellobiose transport system substrate-binding protein
VPSPGSPPAASALTRRGLLGAAGLAALGLAGALSGCTGGTLSSDPHQLVLWYWNRSLNPRYLKQAASGISGASRYRVRSDLTGNSNWDTKLRTTLAGRAYIPDIVMINSNVSLYFPAEHLFTDFTKYASDDVRGRFYDWKVALGTTPSGRQCFWPVDTGPTGFYYRTDVFDKAGLPTDPTEVASEISTWDKYLAFGERLRAGADAAMQSTATTLFTQYINASKQRYFDDHDRPIFEDRNGTVRQAWELSVEAIKAKVTGNLQSDTDKNAGWVSGKAGANIEGAWWSQVVKDTAPDTKGNWRVTSQPERPGNSGGSFLAVPSTCKDPKAAYEFLEWMTTSDRQATTFNDIQLFPSTPASFDSGIMRNPGTFFGDQNPLDVFATIADNVPTSYISTYESQTGSFGTEIANVESAGKDPERAWNDAVAQANKSLEKKGVVA